MPVSRTNAPPIQRPQSQVSANLHSHLPPAIKSKLLILKLILPLDLQSDLPDKLLTTYLTQKNFAGLTLALKQLALKEPYKMSAWVRSPHPDRSNYLRASQAIYNVLLADVAETLSKHETNFVDKKLFDLKAAHYFSQAMYFGLDSLSNGFVSDLIMRSLTKCTDRVLSHDLVALADEFVKLKHHRIPLKLMPFYGQLGELLIIKGQIPRELITHVREFILVCYNKIHFAKGILTQRNLLEQQRLKSKATHSVTEVGSGAPEQSFPAITQQTTQNPIDQSQPCQTPQPPVAEPRANYSALQYQKVCNRYMDGALLPPQTSVVPTPQQAYPHSGQRMSFYSTSTKQDEQQPSSNYTYHQ